MKFFATPPVDGALCRFVTIDAEMAHPVPDSMSDEAAALLEPLSVAIATMRKAAAAPGSSVLIAGAGPIGVMCAQTARAFGAARIVVSDPLSARRERVLRFGATEVLDPAADDVAALDPSGRRVRRRQRRPARGGQRHQGGRTCGPGGAGRHGRRRLRACRSPTSRTWRSP